MSASSFLHKIENYFSGDFPREQFSYVLFPFLRIFKLFGFVPVKLKNGEILRNRNFGNLEWDITACMGLFLGLMIYGIGFLTGIHHLSALKSFSDLRATSIISFITSWAQICALFVVSLVALFTSWTNIAEMRQLCFMIFHIDHRLQSITNSQIDYSPLRQRFFVQFVVMFAVPLVLSMVNCTIILEEEATFDPMSLCYCFLCFAPILLLTFKEFQFYNLLHILKMKISCVNKQLKSFGTIASRKRPKYHRVIFMQKMQSISEMPLTSMTPTTPPTTAPFSPSPSPSQEQQQEDDSIAAAQHHLSVETLQRLLDVYSSIADAVEMVMKIFSWHLVLLTTLSFGVITIQSYNLFAHMVHSLQIRTYQLMFVVGWILVQITVVGLNVSICSATSKAMSATGPLLHKIRMPGSAIGGTHSPGCLFYQTLQLFSLEVLQRKNNFSAAGFFDMNNKLITSIITAVTTYLVIIIQFHLASSPQLKNQN